MALELLAGPFPIQDEDGANLEASYGQKAFYDDTLGLCMYSPTAGASVYVVQMDGTARRKAYNNTFAQFSLDCQTEDGYLIHEGVFESAAYVFNKAACVAHGEAVASGDTNHVVYAAVRLADRYIDAYPNRVRWLPLDLLTYPATEHLFVGFEAVNTSPLPSFSRSEKSNILYILYSSGEIIRYDYVLKERVGSVLYVDANKGGWYSRRHDVFITLHDEGTYSSIRVWANAIRPATLSAPAATSSPSKGKVSSISVQILGDHGEPCAGETVDWSLDGAGALSSLQSISNEDGYAFVEYVAPVDSTPSITITAQVLF